MTASSKKALTHIMCGDDGDFVFGKPWTQSHAMVEGQKVGISESLMASTIWWWRTYTPSFPDNLTEGSWKRIKLVISSTNHEWRLLWENALFFYEAYARWGNEGYLFDKPAILLTEHEKLLLFIAEMHLTDKPRLLDKVKDLIKADLGTDKGVEIVTNKERGKNTGLRNTARSRKARPWRVLEILDKKCSSLTFQMMENGVRCRK